MLYKSRELQVNAVRWEGVNEGAVWDLCGEALVDGYPQFAALLILTTDQGERPVLLGSWIVKDALGKLHVMSDEKFYILYEAIA